MSIPAAPLPTRPPTHQFGLLKQRRFAPFFWTQFLGAANDNIFKVAFTGLVTYQTALFSGVDGKTAAFLISAIFIVPFVLFSATSGQISDKYDKARVMRFVKSLEIAIMLIGAAGFVLHEVLLLYAGTFLMGLHSTLFGPVKYAYLPQQLATEELVGGNGMVEMGSFVAILIGTILGGELASFEQGPVWVAGLCLVVAVLGRCAVAFVPASPSDQPRLAINWNPVTETWRNLELAYADRTIFLAMIGISWLWFLGATFLTSFFSFSKDVLGGDQQVVTLLLAVFSIGIGTGSLLCEKLSREKVEIGLVPFGSIGMTVFAIDIFFATHNYPRALNDTGESLLLGARTFASAPGNWRIIADLFLLSMFSGLYSVPLYALLQSRCKPTHRARIIAANNILNAAFMIASSVLAMLLFSFGYTIPQLFLIIGILNVVVALHMYWFVPEFPMRFLGWLLTRTVLRVRGPGTRKLPHDGAALLVCNPISAIEALAVLAESARQIRFVIEERFFKGAIFAFVFRTARAIPLAAADRASAMSAETRARIEAALTEGDVVCIFDEAIESANYRLWPDMADVAARHQVPVYLISTRKHARTMEISVGTPLQA